MEKIIGFLMIIILLFAGCTNHKAGSIAIIGGVNGPTAIFVLGKVKWVPIIAAIIVVIIVIAIIYFTKRKNNSFHFINVSFPA